MIDRTQLTNEVRIHGIRKREGKRGATYVARWRVNGKEWQQTFPTVKLADGFRADLLRAARAGEPFDTTTGRPQSMGAKDPPISWLDHAIDFMRMKWPESSPKYRKSLAESLTHITIPLLIADKNRPNSVELRRALFRWAFNVPVQRNPPPAELAEAVAWVKTHTRPTTDLSDPVVVRSVLEAIAMTLDGGRAANSTLTRRRSALHNCLEFAVELKRLDTNPLTSVRRKRLPPTPAIDRRRVANPTQARALLAAVRANDPDLEAFFATLYYAGPRPGEVLNLRPRDCSLPRDGWGQLLLASSYQRAGAAWTDSGEPAEERSLKHRAIGDTRPVPAHPALVRILREHIARYELGPDEHLFLARNGRAGSRITPPYDKPVSMKTIYRAWTRARQAVLSPSEFDSPLARRPYDLRHACLSTWLNAGVAPVQVAEWAGHGVTVLLSVYAKCLDDQEHTAMKRIEIALED